MYGIGPGGCCRPGAELRLGAVLTTARSRLQEEIAATELRYTAREGGTVPGAVFPVFMRAVQVRDDVAASDSVVNAAWLKLYLANAMQSENGPHPWPLRIGAALGLVGVLAGGFAVYRKWRRR